MILTSKIEWVQRTKGLIRIGIKRNQTKLQTTNHSIMEYFKNKRGQRDFAQSTAKHP
jgi:hypothetical protein